MLFADEGARQALGLRRAAVDLRRTCRADLPRPSDRSGDRAPGSPLHGAGGRQSDHRGVQRPRRDRWIARVDLWGNEQARIHDRGRRSANDRLTLDQVERVDRQIGRECAARRGSRPQWCPAHLRLRPSARHVLEAVRRRGQGGCACSGCEAAQPPAPDRSLLAVADPPSDDPRVSPRRSSDEGPRYEREVRRRGLLQADRGFRARRSARAHQRDQHADGHGQRA